MSMKVVFFGSPDFAIPSLVSIHKEYDIVGVVTQPDRPAGRGKVITPSPIKVIAQQYGLPILQPNRLKDPGVVEQLLSWNADFYIVAAFGQIFRKNILEIPKFGLINVHASLLPRWRGAAPIQAAIIAADKLTGITIMKLDEGIDTGDFLTQQKVEIDPNETTGELSDRLSKVGADLLVKTLPDYFNGRISLVHQNEQDATYAGMIHKEDAILDLNEPAELLCRKVRAYQPWPVSRLELDGTNILIHKAESLMSFRKPAGGKYVYKNFPAVSTSEGLLILKVIQLPGKKPMDGKSFLQGNRAWGDILN
jgi:methionyl-tRNA formyltransferase